MVVVVTWFTTYRVTTMTGGFSHGSVPSIAQRLLVNGMLTLFSFTSFFIR